MTKLEALQSLVEYDNTNLFTKALLDNGITPTATYASSDKKEIDLALCDVLLAMARLPEFKEGSHSVKYNSKQLLNWRDSILQEYGKASGYRINGRSIR
jgi:hypothetical protein